MDENSNNVDIEHSELLCLSWYNNLARYILYQCVWLFLCIGGIMEKQLYEKEMNYQIEKNLPIEGEDPRSGGKWQRLFNEMEIGDSVLFDTRDEAHRCQQSARRAVGFKIVTRIVAKGKVRAWKAKADG